MAARGDLRPRPDVILFADTGDEPASVMRHLDWLEGEITRMTNGQMEVKRVSAGRKLSDDIRHRQQSSGHRFTVAPFFTANGGMGRRQCTREFKVEPLTKAHRALMGFQPRQRIPARSCEIWIGISTDEVIRAGASFDAWAVNRFPLLELRMSRGDCIEWLKRNGYPVPPKSACVYCPFRENAEWRWLKENDPEAFAAACEIDALIRNTPGMKHQEFVHRSLRPLADIDFSSAEARGQGNLLALPCAAEAGCGL
ncbi:hypothetical protein BA190_09540 [Labrys sp. WJW]|nr:hypothetical protein BA190_09540 [Labrys sp. WJW]